MSPAIGRCCSMSLRAGLRCPARRGAHAVGRPPRHRGCRRSGGDLRVELDLAVRDIALTLPLDANRDERVTWGELRAIRDELEPMRAAGTVAVAPMGQPATCSRRARDAPLRRWRLRHPADGRAHCPSARSTAGCTTTCCSTAIRSTARWSQCAGRAADRVVPRANRAPSAPAGDRAVASASAGLFADFLREGIHHILIGYDHLAFLLSCCCRPRCCAAAAWQPRRAGAAASCTCSASSPRSRWRIRSR